MAINNIVEKEALEKIEDSINKETEIPAAYIPIRLSTKGRVGAPALFHMRNFTTEDLMDLALTDEEQLPIQVVKKLQEIIWEKDCDVKKFHEKEVIEALFNLYKIFYSSTLRDIEWELTEEDKDYLADQFGGKDSIEYKKRIAAYERGEWKEHWDIDLNAIKTYDIPETLKTTAHITKKNTGFTYDYELPKYGDILILKKFVDEVFKEQDKKWAITKENILRKQKLDHEFNEGRSSTNGSRIYIPESELKGFKEYEKEKTLFATKCLKALHVVKVNDEDVSNKTLNQRLEIVENPEFDHASFRGATELLNNLKFGLIEDIEAFDPILRKQVTIHYSFRVFTLLQAIRDNDSDQSVITLE